MIGDDILSDQGSTVEPWEYDKTSGSLVYLCVVLAFKCIWLTVREDRMNAIQLLRQRLAEQKTESDLAFFEVPFPDGSMARLPRMPMVPLGSDA